MSLERTFSIIKPDAVAAGNTGSILAMLEGAGFKILALRMTRLTQQQAEKQIVSLYRRWPTRKFGPLEGPEIFAIPKKRDIYKVTGTYEYDLSNVDEHLSGKSKITCILQHGGGKTRIIGLDEKLIDDTTKYSR